jgi:hypothetical protein
MLALKNFLSLFTLVASLAGLVTSQLVVPIVPELDPFYKPDAGFESKPPGTILRTRKIAASYFGLIPNDVQAYQLLYRTTAVDGSAIAAATTVFKPTLAKLDRFVSFHTAYDGAARDGKCDPSYSYQLLSPQVNLISSAEFFLLEAFLLDGNIVSAPDYEGPDAAFAAGRLAGMAALDSMRAVSSFRQLGFLFKPNVVGYGYSGGGIATGWAAQLAASYALKPLPVWTHLPPTKRSWIRSSTNISPQTANSTSPSPSKSAASRISPSSPSNPSNRPSSRPWATKSFTTRPSAAS